MPIIQQPKISDILEAIYPVGSLYFGDQAVCPMAALMPNTTWTLVPSGKAIWTGDGTNGNTTINAALPNIKASLAIVDGANATKAFAAGSTVTGAFVRTNVHRDQVVTGSAVGFDDSFDLGIDAHESNNIYDDSATTVQPPAYVINVWRRTA